MSTFSTITTQVTTGVFTITLNRPDSLNAFNHQMSVELGTALRMAARDDAVRCIVLTGAGRAFCSGQDLQEIRGRYPEVVSLDKNAAQQPLEFAEHLRKKFNPIIARMRSLEKPNVAAYNRV